jgi:hypothetical protein
MGLPFTSICTTSCASPGGDGGGDGAPVHLGGVGGILIEEKDARIADGGDVLVLA